MIGLLFAFALAAEPAAPPAPEPGADYVTKPVWVSRPIGEDMARYYPVEANGEDGRAVVECTVGSNGVMKACRAIEHSPARFDFDKAAVAVVTARFKMAPEDRDGRPTAERPVRIPVVWTFSEPEAPVDVLAAEPALGSDGVRKPQWAALPSADDLVRVYPKAALRSGTSGRAVLACKVTTAGRLTDCSVAEQSGADFGQAALDLAPRIRMTPATRDGVPIESDIIRIPLMWNPPY